MSSGVAKLMIVGLLMTMFCGCQSAKEPEQKSEVENERIIETGMFAKTPYPNGCVDCHKQADGKDMRLTTMVRRFPEHPRIIESATLDTCLDCHGDEDDEEDFGKRLHLSHAKSQAFTEELKGNCQACHFLKSDGEVELKQ